jgi:hypothetical protein
VEDLNVEDETEESKKRHTTSADAKHPAYFFGPFALQSEVHLPELPEGHPGSRLVVTIGFADQTLDTAGLEEVNPWMAGSRDRFLLTIPGTGRFLVSNGDRVDIEPAADAHEIDLRLYLLGSVFGALCHQNEFLPLHASAIERGGRVTAFLGESGAGKSTLAAFLTRRGHTVISDDICLLGRPGPEELVITPVAGWLKLWRESLDALGEEAIEANRLISKDDKFRVYLEAGDRKSPQLACLVLLERPETDAAQSAPRVERVSLSEAVARMMDMVYLSEIAQLEDGDRRLFERCARIIGKVQVFRLIAPLGFDRMDEVLDVIEAELLSDAQTRER